jgi:hypothetical protein
MRRVVVAACAGAGASAVKAVTNVAKMATLVSAIRVRSMMFVFFRPMPTGVLIPACG